MVKSKVGDIFCFQIPNEEYIFGRILFDVTQQGSKPKLLKSNSPLIFFNDSLLVEFYRITSTSDVFDESITSDLLVNGVFIDPIFIKKGVWKIVGFQNVNPEQVDFPEALTAFEDHALFRKGEIALPLNLSESRLREINVYPTVFPPVVLFDICLYYLGLYSYINPEYISTSNLSHSDLRFSNFRDQIYKILGEDSKQSYVDASKKYGCDFFRFYK